MKIHDFAYRVAMRTMQLLEKNQHYKVSEEHRKAVASKILEEVDALMTESS